MPGLSLLSTLALLLVAAAPLHAERPSPAAGLGEVLPIVPDLYAPASPPTNAPRTAPQPDPQAAAALYAQAVAAADAGEPSRAMELATRALLADPDHADARRVLCYERVGSEWLTPYGAAQSPRGRRWDPRFGWVAPDELPRLVAGQRPLGRRWLSAEAAEAWSGAVDAGWSVRTDRFVVRTNHSLQAAAQLAGELERLFQAWRQMFAGYWLTDAEVRRLFAGERSPRKPRPMVVFYHRDKEGYVNHLRGRQPRIAETLGIYFDDLRQAHFYADAAVEPGLRLATLHHEAAHQLFAENGPGRRDAGRDANYWLVEGVACYFELLAPTPDGRGMSIARQTQGRLPSAVAAGPVLPLADLAALGRDDLQRRPDLAAVYAQAAGVVTLLRHGGAAADREALVRTLRGVYAGGHDFQELARQTGRPFPDIDRDYREFLANLSRGDSVR